ncbi:MAG: polyprenyl synthetase family protein [Candidatus Aminicenantes bacterium]|nr:polyprenyl synthetase family protein [Candidatus Aminicenantes bacterium]
MDNSPVAAALSDLYRPILPDLALVEDELRRVVPAANPLLAEIGDYLFLLGGKRIRPALLLLSNRLFGLPDGESVFWSAMIEVLHTASLIHDDIVDNSDRRRGQATVHARWGANITVLLGDFLYIQSILLALRKRNYALIDILAGVTAAMIEGELVETSWSGKPDIPEPVYREILNKKTASLFAGACRIGAELGHATPAQSEAMEAFGRCLGMCFQIVDDWLDYAGDAGTLGKPVLSDLREGRFTLPILRCLKRLEGEPKRRILARIESLASDPEVGPEILDAVRATGALAETLEEARRSAAEAEAILRTLPESEAREALLGLIGLLLNRDK